MEKPALNESREAELDIHLRYGEVKPGSAAWSLGGRVTAQVIQVAGFVVLSRLLPPTDFGVMATAVIFTGFAQIFTDLGIGPAVVARQRLSERFLTSAFWVNVGSGVVIGGLMAVLALPLSRWLGYPALTWVIPLASLALVCSFSTVHVALLERRFEFRRIGLLEVAAALVGQSVAIAAALGGHGLLGLALAPVAAALSLSVLAQRASGWRPGLPMTAGEMRALRSYSAPLVWANVVNYCARNIDDLLVSNVFGAAALAFYSRAYQLMLAPVMQATLALGRVYQAAFASDAKQPERLERRHELVETDVATFGLLAGAVVAVNGYEWVDLVFGETWLPMGSLLAIFALSIGPQVITSANGAVLRATGDTKLLFRLGLISSVLLVAAVSVAALWSVEAMAWAFVAHSAVAVPLTLGPVCRRLKFSLARVTVAIGRAAVIPLCLYLVLRSALAYGPTYLWGGFVLQAGITALALVAAGLLTARRHRSFDALQKLGTAPGGLGAVR
jgi:PST family polysaccharide transporter